MILCLLAIQALAAPYASAADLPVLIGLPDQGFTLVEGFRELREDWGVVSVALEVEGFSATAPSAAWRDDDPPTFVRSVSRCGPCELRTLLLRTPTDPRSADVIRATVANPSGDPVHARLTVKHSASGPDLALSPEGLSAGARRLLSLPADPVPTLPLNDWGLATDAGANPSWARPNEPCDPAFRNIRVGWRHQPITYRFRVEPKAGRRVILGLCESHWGQAAQRPLLLQVEGAPDRRVDPVGDWGQHVPRCLAFDARDINEDGWLTVTSIATADAPDTNSILNAIWVFPEGAAEDLDAVKRGERSAAAERYVDVGGEADQSLYATGDIRYDLELPPASEQTLTFLVATGGAPAPNGVDSAIAADRLLEDATNLWTEWYDNGCSVSVPDAEIMRVWRASLAAIPLVRGQVSKYLLARASGAPDSLSYASIHAISRALDLTSHPREAEASMLLLWDKPLPDPIAPWGQREDGLWQCEEGNWGGHCRALSALTQHYCLTRDRAWLARAYPSIAKGAERLITALTEHGGRLPQTDATCDPNPWATVALAGAADTAKARDDSANAKRYQEAAERLGRAPAEASADDLSALKALVEGASPQGFPPGPGSPAAYPDAAEGARFIALLRDLLVDDSGEEPRLLAGVPEEWLAAEGGVAVRDLPTRAGPLTFRARLIEPGTLKLALDGRSRLASPVSIAVPASLVGGKLSVVPFTLALPAKDGRAIQLLPYDETVVLTIRAPN